MSEKDRHGVNEDRVRRLERAVAAGDEQAIRAAGGAGSREGREAARRVTVRRTAIEQRRKRDEAAKAEKEKGRAEKAKEQAGKGEDAPEAASGKGDGKQSGTPLRDASVTRQQQSSGVATPDRAVTAGRQVAATSPPARSATPLRDAAIARQRTFAAQRQLGRVDARGR